MKRNLENLKRYNLICIFLIILIIQNFSYSQEKASKIDELLKTYQDYGLFNGTVLVAEGGKVILKKGYGLANMEWGIPNKPETKFRIGSLTKQFTATIILQLVEEGKINLEGKISDYLPEYRKDTGEKVTIHHLLTHTSGIPSYTNMPNFFEEISRNPYEVDEFIRKYCSGDLEFEPGKKFSYNNSGYFILGAIIEKVTRKPYEEVLKERIFDPLGMKNTGYDHNQLIIQGRAGGYEKTVGGYENAPYLDMSLPYSAGALYSTVEDLYLWDQALYTENVLSQKMKDLMFKPHEKALGASYGYGWIISTREFPNLKEKIKTISHGGGINGFNTLIERLVDYRHLIVLFNNTGATQLGEISSTIIKILFNAPYDLPKKPLADVLYKQIIEKDVDSALKEYENLKKNYGKEYNFQPSELNRLGYHLLKKMKREKDALEIFKLNVKENPNYARGYEALAEAYMASGKKELAIKNYAKALELDPNNRNALEKLNELFKGNKK